MKTNSDTMRLMPAKLSSPKLLPTTTKTTTKRLLTILFLLLLGGGAAATHAHPLGNFTVNHFARLTIGGERVRVRYVVDMAEIPTFQESQAIDANQDGALSAEESKAYLERAVLRYAEGLLLTIDGARLPLQVTAQNMSTPQGAGGLSTLRVECDMESAPLSAVDSSGAHRLRFEDTNQPGRTGWREIVIAPVSGAVVFDSTAYGSAVTDELKAYPQDMLVAPLSEQTADLSWTTAAAGAPPSGAVTLRTRDGRPVVAQTPDQFAELIHVPKLTPLVALFGLLLAAGFGAMHAFSPGHGKTVVGAYLVGSRGTAKHAAFLGLTVTITHTIGVVALGLITLFASRYIVPERLIPILSFISGAIVLIMGLSLFIGRLRTALNRAPPQHGHDNHAHADAHPHEEAHAHNAHPHSHDAHAHDGHASHSHAHADEHGHAHEHDDGGDASAHTHTHGGSTHTHLPPGADGSPITWRGLLALGISGGLLPCPSALVVMLAAISAGKVAYGLVLIVAFSVGLAATLTSIGLLFVYAGRYVSRSIGDNRLVRVLPILSALVIAGLGALLCYEVLAQQGFHFTALAGHLFGGGGAQTEAAATGGEPSFASIGAFSVLGLGLVFGLKHATEVDHVIAVSTIVSEQRNIWRAALVGGLWGVGHTISLVVVGAVVLALRVAIPERVANWLEFGVALMIIGLGVNALVHALRRRAAANIHAHPHDHDGAPHAHLHFHEQGAEHVADVPVHTHAISRIGMKPLLVGAMHGLAGSAALTLLVLTQINSAALGLLYLAVFGIGSIFGMLLMSGLVGLPFALSSRRLTGVGYGLQTLAGALSIAFGLWYAYETGIASGLL